MAQQVNFMADSPFVDVLALAGEIAERKADQGEDSPEGSIKRLRQLVESIPEETAGSFYRFVRNMAVSFPNAVMTTAKGKDIGMLVLTLVHGRPDHAASALRFLAEYGQTTITGFNPSVVELVMKRAKARLAEDEKAGAGNSFTERLSANRRLGNIREAVATLESYLERGKRSVEAASAAANQEAKADEAEASQPETPAKPARRTRKQ